MVRYWKAVPLVMATLSDCASLSPAAMTKLAGLDVLETPPGQIVIAAVMPVPVRLRTGDVILTFAVDAAPPLGPVLETLPLEIVDSGPMPGVSASPSFERVQKARIAEADIARLTGAQAKARVIKTSGVPAKGSLSVRIAGGCRDGAIGGGPLIASIYMQRRPDEKFFPLIASLDLRKLAGAASFDKLPRCDGS